MIKSYLSLVCLFVLLISATTVSAQLSIKPAGKTYKIPKFIKTVNVNSSRDSFTLKLDSQFISYHILEPLSSSPYPFEVRCSSSGITDPGYTMNVLKANKDSLWWERYEMYITTTLVKGATKSIEIKKDSQGQPIYLYVYYKRNSIAVSSYSVIDTLIHLGLFTQPSMEAILLKLKQRGVKLQSPSMLDCCSDFLFNIKLNNHYRRFIYNGYMPMANPDVKELAEASKLVNTFYYICSDR